MKRVTSLARGGVPIALAAALLGACSAPAAPPPAKEPARPPAASAPPTSVPAAPAAPTAPAKPALPTAPVSLKVGTLAVGSWAGVFIADERGYFKELGLNVERRS
jgi:hypothetical protein